MPPRVRILMLIVVLLMPSALRAQNIPTPDALVPVVDAYLAPLRALDVFTGVVLVARGDSVLVEKAYGMADLEHDVAMVPASTFRIASITKQFTQALAGRLAERAALDLDGSIQQWLPDFPGAGEITLRMLLDHRAGVANVNSLQYDEEALAPNTLATLVDSLARMPLDFEPGSARRYSNGGYAVATRILELAGRRDYGALLREEILRPLGLENTFNESDGAIVFGRARGYTPSPVEFGTMALAPFQEMATKTGGGSLVSTAGDLHRWALAVGSHPLLMPDSWADLFPARESWAATGRSPGYNAALLRDGNLVAVVLVNNYAAGMTYDVAQALIELAAGREAAPLAVSSPRPVDPGVVEAARGAYRLPEEYLQVGDGVLEIRQVDDELVAFLEGVPIDVLVPQGRRTFLLRTLWSTLTVEQPIDRTSPGLELRPLYRDGVYHAARIAGRQP